MQSRTRKINCHVISSICTTPRHLFSQMKILTILHRIFLSKIVNGCGRKDGIICKLTGETGGGECDGGIGGDLKHDGSMDVQMR